MNVESMSVDRSANRRLGVGVVAEKYLPPAEPEHPNLSMAHWNIAKCLRNLDRPAEAACHRRRCWEIECKGDGPAAAGTLQTAHALAEDLLAADQPEEAMTVVESALTAAAQATDEDEDRAGWVEKLRNMQGEES